MRQILALTPRDAAEAIWQGIRARIRLVVGVGIASAVLAIALNAAAPSHAGAELVFAPLSGDRTLVATGITPPALPAAQELLSDQILGRILSETLPGRYQSVEQLRGLLEVDGDPATRHTTLLAEGSSDGTAVALASAWSGAVLRSRQDVLNATFAAVRNVLGADLDDTRRQLGGRRVANAAELRRRERYLGASLDRLTTVQQTTSSDTGVARGAAVVQQRPAVISELVALLVGLLLGAVLAVALDFRDRSLRTSASLRAAFGLPVLGSLHSAGNIAAKVLVAGDGQAPRSLLVTAAGDERDAATVASALAESLHARKKRAAVIAVADLESAEAVLARVRMLIAEGNYCVIVVAASVHDDSETLLLGQWLDAWLVAARVGVTGEDDARVLAADLEGLPRRPDGLVLAADRTA